MIVKTMEDLDILLAKVREAQLRYAEFPQELVDLIFRHAAQSYNFV